MKKHMKDIAGKTQKELTALLSEKRESLRAARFSAAGARAKDPSEGRKLRADIARILTAHKTAN